MIKMTLNQLIIITIIINLIFLLFLISHKNVGQIIIHILFKCLIYFRN
jgi:hypothetical protein